MPFSTFLTPYRVAGATQTLQNMEEYQTLSSPASFTSTPSDVLGTTRQRAKTRLSSNKRMHGEGRWDGRSNLNSGYSMPTPPQKHNRHDTSGDAPLCYATPRPGGSPEQDSFPSWVRQRQTGSDTTTFVQPDTHPGSTNLNFVQRDSTSESRHRFVTPCAQSILAPLPDEAWDPTYPFPLLPSLPTFMDSTPRIRRRILDQRAHGIASAYGTNVGPSQLFEVDDPALNAISILRISQCRYRLQISLF